MPPTASGVSVAEAMNILETFPVAEAKWGSVANLHLLSETMKIVSADRRLVGGGPDWRTPAIGLASKAYAAERARLIRPDRSLGKDDVPDGNPYPHESRDTTHFSVADAAGNAHLPFQVFRLAGRFGEIEVVGFEPADEADGLGGFELPVQIDHDVGLGAERLAQCRHFLDDALVGNGRGELDAAKALADPFDGKVAPFLERCARQARDIGRNGRVPAPAEQARYRHAEILAGEVPERDVERAVAHVVVGAQLALQVVVDLLAAFRVAAEQVRGEHDALGHRCGRADPVGHVFAGQAVVGPDAHRVAARLDLAALLVDPVGDALGAVLGQAEVRHLIRERVNLDPVDPAHVAPLRTPSRH